MLGSFKLVMTE